MAKMKVLKQEIGTLQLDNQDYISLTDIAHSKDGETRAADIIKNWLRNRSTLEFIGTWEQLYNPNFKVVEFDHFKMSSGLHSFVLSPGKWVEKTNAIGIVVKSGRYGGTYAHKDIAFEFASAINPIFKLYLIKEFQRLKEQEFKQLGWDIKRNFVYKTVGRGILTPTINTDNKYNLSPSKHHRKHAGIWQERYYEHTIRDEKDWNNIMEYIKCNPIKHGYVDVYDDWGYSSFAE